MIDNLKKQVLLSGIKHSGNFKDCVPIGPYVLLYGPTDEADLALTKENIDRYPNVKIAKILEWEIDSEGGRAKGPDGRELPMGWVLEERAPGKPLGDTRTITCGVEIAERGETSEKYGEYLAQVRKYIKDLWLSTDISFAALTEFVAGQNFLRDKTLKLDCTNPGNVNHSRRHGLTSFDYSTDVDKKYTSGDEFLADMCGVFLPIPPSFYVKTRAGRFEPEIILPPKEAAAVSAVHNNFIAPRLRTALACNGLKGDVREYAAARLENMQIMEQSEAEEYINSGLC